MLDTLSVFLGQNSLLFLEFFSQLLFIPFQNHLSHGNWNSLSLCINPQLYFSLLRLMSFHYCSFHCIYQIFVENILSKMHADYSCLIDISSSGKPHANKKYKIFSLQTGNIYVKTFTISIINLTPLSNPVSWLYNPWLIHMCFIRIFLNSSLQLMYSAHRCCMSALVLNILNISFYSLI